MRHLIGGTSCIVLGLCGMSAWWPQFAQTMRGFVPFALLVIGLVAVLSSYNRLGMGAGALGSGDDVED